jgi:hypothetical protein
VVVDFAEFCDMMGRIRLPKVVELQAKKAKEQVTLHYDVTMVKTHPDLHTPQLTGNTGMQHHNKQSAGGSGDHIRRMSFR